MKRALFDDIPFTGAHQARPKGNLSM